MSKRTLIVIAGVLICGLLLSGVVLAMSSDNYRLDWFTPLTSGGGGATDSTNYAIDLTVGQSATGASSSTNYSVCLGYWCGATAAGQSGVYLPLVLRNN